MIFLSNNLDRVLEELNAKIQKDQRENSTLPNIVKTPRPELSAVDVKIRKTKSKKQFKDLAGTNTKEKDVQSKDKEEERIPKINPPNSPKSIGTTPGHQFHTKPQKGFGTKSVENSVNTTAAMKNKPGWPASVELREEDEFRTPTKNCTTDPSETLRTHPEDRSSQSLLTQHGRVVPPHPVERHSRQRNMKDRDSIGFHSSVIEMMSPSKSDSSQDSGRTLNTFDPKHSKVFKRLTSDFPKTCFKGNIKTSDTKVKQVIGKCSLQEHKEGLPVNVECEKLKPVQSDTSLLNNNTLDSRVNTTKPIIPSVAKPTKTTKKALPSNLGPAKALSSSGQARRKKRTTAGSSSERVPLGSDTTPRPKGSLPNYIITKETTHAPHKTPEDLLKDTEETQSSRHQQDGHGPVISNDPPSCLKMGLLTSAAENQAETSHFKSGYKKGSQLCSIQERTTKKSKQSGPSIPSRTHKANTLETLVELNGPGLSESSFPKSLSSVDQTSKGSRSSDVLESDTTEANPGTASSAEKLPESLKNSSTSTTTQKTRIFTNDKNKKGVQEMPNKTKTSLTLTALTQNCAAMQKSSRSESSSTSLSPAAHRPPLPSATPTPNATSGPLSQESGVDPGPQGQRQARVFTCSPQDTLPSYQVKTLNNHLRTFLTGVLTGRCLAMAILRSKSISTPQESSLPRVYK